MKSLGIFLVLIAIALHYSECAPSHHYDDYHHYHKKPGAKELIYEAASKSSEAVKLKGAAALAVAKKPFELAKKVAAGVVAAKAIAVKKVAAAGAAIKAGVAVKAGVIAKKALAIKFRPKVREVGEKLHKLTNKLIVPALLKKDKTKDKLEDGLEIIKSKIAKAAHTVLHPEPNIISNRIAEPIIATLIKAL